MIDNGIPRPGTRWAIVASHGAAVMADNSGTSHRLHHLPAGTLVICAGHMVNEQGNGRVRIDSPAGWIDADTLAPAPSAAVHLPDFETFLQSHRQIAAGDHYGIEFPIDLAGLQEAGPEFLTRAFRLSGAIAADNHVTAIVSLDKLDLRGASENGFLELAYARDEPGLETKLFVKFPPADVQHKYGLLRLSNGEIEMARLSRERPFPVRTTRYYFGDHSATTGNYILITQRVAFGKGAVEPAYRKGFDHEVPCIEEHYELLARELARLVAAHKRGDLGHDLESRFPFARAARDFDPIVDPEPRLDRLIDFIGRVAPQLFAPDVTRPEFLRRWREDVLFGLEHKDTILAYLLADIDYTGLCHVNLNIDNAWFWRDDAGTLHAGLLDWGGAGQASLAQALSGMLMMPEPEKYISLVDRVIDAFIGECVKEGCPILDNTELKFQYKASLFSTSIFMFVTIISDYLPYFPEDYFSSFERRTDDRFLEDSFYSAVVWIDNMLREWLEDLTPGDVARQIVAQAGAVPQLRRHGG